MSAQGIVSPPLRVLAVLRPPQLPQVVLNEVALALASSLDLRSRIAVIPSETCQGFNEA